MNKIIEDFEREHFSRRELLLYGVVYPLGLVALIGFAGWLLS